MNAICLIVAGAIQATLPATEFTLQWQHSIEKTRWIERYRIDGDSLMLVQASVEGNGAGMEPPAAARLRDGAWVWQPDRRLATVVLAASEFGGDYQLCAQGRCRSLRELRKSATGGPVELRACEVNESPESGPATMPRP